MRGARPLWVLSVALVLLQGHASATQHQQTALSSTTKPATPSFATPATPQHQRTAPSTDKKSATSPPASPATPVASTHRYTRASSYFPDDEVDDWSTWWMTQHHHQHHHSHQHRKNQHHHHHHQHNKHTTTSTRTTTTTQHHHQDITTNTTTQRSFQHQQHHFTNTFITKHQNDHTSTNTQHHHHHIHHHQHQVRHHHGRRRRRTRRRRRRYLGNVPQPRFTQAGYHALVPEDLPVGSSVLQVRATVDGSHSHSLVRYRVSDPERFAIDGEGVLTTTQTLDYEHTKGEYRLYVYVEEPGSVQSARQEVRVPVFIRIQDREEPPYFESTDYTFAVTESALPGTYVGTVVARDPDLDFDRYELRNVSPAGAFAVEPRDGIITVASNVFTSARVFSFEAAAVDLTGLSSSVPVRVNVIAAHLTWHRDGNRHKPRFSQCAELDGLTVPENRASGLRVVMVTATDEDSGVNGEVTYHLLNDLGSFAIETKTGVGYITTTRVLDRDGEDKEFFLTVIAKDGAPPQEVLQEACTFRVIVEDTNDNSPNFEKQLYERNVATDHGLNTPVLRVLATDMDAGVNAQVVYSLDETTNDSTYFSIDSSTGIIKLVKALQESMASTKTFHLTARATDQGAAPLTHTVPVRVVVVSSGSLPPTIVFQEPPRPIPENAPLDTTVACYCAQSNVPNEPDVFFILVTGNTGDTNADGTFATRKLSINNPTCPEGSRGVVIYLAVRNLDYEVITKYALTLQVVNTQNARLDEQVLVAVQDVNDLPPILQPFDGAIMENSPPTTITTITATDKDASPEFRSLVYSFDAPEMTADVRHRFSLSPSGELRTLVPLDREERDKYIIPVHVTDGYHNRTSMYWITVRDMNDVAPTFNRTLGVYEVQVPESRHVGKDTGIRLKVDDPDVVNYNSFQIVQGNEQRKFSIDSTTGEVTVARGLDYDDPVRDRNFTLLVRLSDGANEAVETFITIAVINVNDLQPVFDQSSYSFTVTEHEDCNRPFGQVSAMDPDLPPDVDQSIKYQLQENGKTSLNFTINETDGELAIVGCLDREAATRGSITIYPMAVDSGGEGHVAEPPTVTIIISDLNDNHPFIRSPAGSRTTIMENTDPNTLAAVTLQLADLDAEEHGCPCSLAFDSSTPADVTDKFQVTQLDESTSRYAVKPRVTLDREEHKVYRLPFRTTDRQGVNGLRYLTVEVGDKNDSPMSDGESAIQVYNYLGQFPRMVIGSMYVTDLDDYDLADKVFEIDASTSLEADTYFDVDYNTGNITMQKDTPSDTYVLMAKVEDKFRNESAVGEVTITVVDLTEEAIRRAGSFRVAGYSPLGLLQRRGNAGTGTSLYERLKVEIGSIHGIAPGNVDIFSLRGVGRDVDVRYTCRGSPYYTSARLNGLMLTHLTQLNSALGATISRVNLDRCLYESDPDRPCRNTSGGRSSCQQTLKPNMTSPLVVSGETTTMVGVDITDQYDCNCGVLEPLPSVCYEGYCLNGGVCEAVNNTLVCECPSKLDHGPRCELKSARFERGYAWYEPPKVCENSSVFLSFVTRESSGVLLYSGPTVARPWSDYPRDFLYVVLKDWVLETYLDLGTGTISMAIPVEQNTHRAFDCSITWGKLGITFEVINCSGNSGGGAACRKSVPLLGETFASHLLNLAAPLQLGGVAAMASFKELASTHGWTLTPPTVLPFHGCVLELRHNDYLYDLNATDYDKETYRPCDAPAVARVIMGKQSIVIIVVSLLFLIMLVLLILCLARRGRKAVYCPELDGVVKETIGGTDLEGFGEKDVTEYDLKLLRVCPEGYLVNGGNTRHLPDVANDALKKRKAPPAHVLKGRGVGAFIDENIKKVDKEPSDFDDVRHYCYEGHATSPGTLSSVGSAGGSSHSTETFDHNNDWGPRFEKLNEIYRRGSDKEEDSDCEFPNVPKQKKRAASPTTVTETTPPKSPESTPSPTPRPAEQPTVTHPETEGQSGDRRPQPPQPPPRTAETLSSLASYVDVKARETWC